ncbi:MULTISPECIES: ion transporter [unclassified Streptomyces]|uniref:ion transporter n=1 Tax=unclassified Streptomyces TaxID=2593676 RepID=UPI000DC7E79D|nr:MULTISPECIES: ion transporter [unclassified Streptomyces]AWZ08295.1 ion transporter [Streptomyces sp. ICC4]AWZ16064.1 ion transporter [Streptomyces sp. ICC1]
MTDPTAVDTRRGRLAAHCRDVCEAPAFSLAVFAVILFNAALLGVETYSGLSAEYSRLLGMTEHFCLVAFTLEMVIRLAAHADRPKAFFRDPWNLFDLLVVSSAFIPFLRENTTLLRLLRLARVLRTARFMPQLRVLLVAVGRSLPGTVSFLFVGALILYVYAMIGWICFSGHDPAHYGSIGRAGLTLFLLMTLEGLGDAVYAGLAVSPLSIVYYASYVLLASFVLLNVLIGVVLNALEEAREMEEQSQRAAQRAEAEVDVADELLLRIAAVRGALDDMEAQLGSAGIGAQLPAASAPAAHASAGAR